MFPPDFFNASFWFSQIVFRYYKSYQYRSLLSVGCGTGVDLFLVANHVVEEQSKDIPKLTMTDINPNAIKTTNNNYSFFPSNMMSVEECDLFPVVNQQYDFFCWNMPFFKNQSHKLEKYTKARDDPEFSTLQRFLQTVRQHSHPTTHIMLMFSQFHIEEIHDLITQNGLTQIESTTCKVESHLGQKLPFELCFDTFLNLYALLPTV